MRVIRVNEDLSFLRWRIILPFHKLGQALMSYWNICDKIWGSVATDGLWEVKRVQNNSGSRGREPADLEIEQWMRSCRKKREKLCTKKRLRAGDAARPTGPLKEREWSGNSSGGRTRATFNSGQTLATVTVSKSVSIEQTVSSFPIGTYRQHRQHRQQGPAADKGPVDQHANITNSQRECLRQIWACQC